MVMVSGGSGSGKSEFAENYVVHAKEQNKAAPLLYLATMMGEDAETRKKILRHRQMRAGKGFVTKEVYLSLKTASIPKGSIVLLECMSNLAANEYFSKDGAGENTVPEIVQGLQHLQEQASLVVVVTNEIFCDGCQYPEETKQYIRLLGEINRQMADMAQEVYEIVCGIPVRYK